MLKHNDWVEKPILSRFKLINKVMFRNKTYPYISSTIRTNSYTTYDNLFDLSSTNNYEYVDLTPPIYSEFNR